MPAAWVSAAVGIYSAASGADSARRSGNQAADAARSAQDAANRQQDFTERVYNQNLPFTQATQQQSLQSMALQNQLAQQQLDRSSTAWNQNQQATAGATGQMGLNALGAQWLDADQQRELLGLQQTLAQSPYKTTTTTPGAVSTGGTASIDAGLTSDQQARLNTLLGKQQAAAMGTGAAGGSGADYWDGYYANGGKFLPGGSQSGAAAGLSSAELAELSTLQKAGSKPTIAKPGQGSGGTTGAGGSIAPTTVQEMDPAVQKARADAQARISQLQGLANANIQAAEVAKGQRVKDTTAGFADKQIGLGNTTSDSILNDSNTIQGDLNTRGNARMAEQTGFYNDQATDVKKTAAQRAADAELRQKTEANAAISNSAAQANRAMLRVGGDPNKMAALAADTANSQQLARIGAGNQIAATNIGNLNAADDAARGLQITGFNNGTGLKYADQNSALAVKSSALDAAREARTNANQTALNMNYGAAQTYDQYANNAKDKANAEQNNLLSGTANFGQGFANTSSANASGANGAAAGAVGSGNTGANAGLQSAQLATNGMNGQYTAGQLGLNAAQMQNNASAQARGAITSGLGTAAGSLYNAYGASGGYGLSNAQASFSQTGLGSSGYGTGLAYGNQDYGDYVSDENAKEDIQAMDDDEVLEGLSSVAPKKYKYKKGKGDGKRHIGPMAQDMNEEFGESVAPGGVRLKVQDQLGLHHAAIRALANRIDGIDARGD